MKIWVFVLVVVFGDRPAIIAYISIVGFVGVVRVFEVGSDVEHLSDSGMESYERIEPGDDVRNLVGSMNPSSIPFVTAIKKCSVSDIAGIVVLQKQIRLAFIALRLALGSREQVDQGFDRRAVSVQLKITSMAEVDSVQAFVKIASIEGVKGFLDVDSAQEPEGGVFE